MGKLWYVLPRAHVLRSAGVGVEGGYNVSGGNGKKRKDGVGAGLSRKGFGFSGQGKEAEAVVHEVGNKQSQDCPCLCPPSRPVLFIVVSMDT